MCSSYFATTNILRVATRITISTNFVFSKVTNRSSIIEYSSKLLLPQWKTYQLFSTSPAKQAEKLISIDYDRINDQTVKTITMKSPKTRNSLSLDMIENLIENMHDISNEGRCRCIIIKGEGKAFSAGHNLKEMTMNEGRDYHIKILSLIHI